jgi:hypothetical protein
MTTESKIDQAFARHIEIMTQALEAPNGLRVKFESKNLATSFRNCCHKARARQRNNIGSSPFENLTITSTPIEGGGQMLIFYKTESLVTESF